MINNKIPLYIFILLHSREANHDFFSFDSRIQKYLYLYNNPVKDKILICRLTNLKGLGISSWGIDDISFLSNGLLSTLTDYVVYANNMKGEFIAQTGISDATPLP